MHVNDVFAKNSKMRKKPYIDYNHYNHYRDSDLDLDLDWERFSELTITDELRSLNHEIEG